MFSKDYYKILNVKPTATLSEIKSQYRKLAFKYHPDKNIDDLVSESVFKDINDAYDTLSNTVKRDQYNSKVLHQFSNYSHQRKPVYNANDAESILQQSIRFQTLVSGMNFYFINQDALHFQLKQLLSNQNIDELKFQADENLNREFINQILTSLKPLKLFYTQGLFAILLDLASTDAETIQKIKSAYKRKKIMNYWEKYKLVLAIATALLLCLIIYFIFK